MIHDFMQRSKFKKYYYSNISPSNTFSLEKFLTFINFPIELKVKLKMIYFHVLSKRDLFQLFYLN